MTHVVRELEVCIFCGGSEMTEEHLIAAWAHRAFARARKPQNQIRGIFRGVDQIALSPDEPVATAKVVCRPCNNGWVSGVDRDAAVVLKPLIRGGREVVLDTDAQAAVAAWIYKTALVFDAADNGSAGPLATLRPQFKATRRAGPGCIIYTGPATRQPPLQIPTIDSPLQLWMLGIRPTSGTVTLTVNVQNPDGATHRGRPQTITIPGYQIMIGALGAYLGGQVQPVTAQALEGFQQIWPAQAESVTMTAAALADPTTGR
jgi:hypothetical protein